MATGALDANGIWQYGEDDSESTFSGLLNKLGGSTSTTVTRLEELSGLTAAQLATHRDNLGVGMVNIIPTSVAQAGGSASANTVGQVTFTTVTSVSLNGVFTSDYNTYRIILEITGHSASAASFMRMRAAGTDNSAASYTDAIHVVTPTTTSRVYHSAATAAEVEYGATGAYFGLHVYDVTGASMTQATLLTRMSTYIGAAGMETATGGIYHNVSTVFDGFSIYPGSGNISGRITVLAVNK